MMIEDMKYEVKGMPDEMRKMVESEVQKQMKGTKKKISTKRIAVAALAATMVVGTTAFAGNQIQQMMIESKAKYGKVTKIQTEETKKNTDYEIPNVKLSFQYLPEGMVEHEGKYHFAENGNVGGITPIVYKMDLGDDAFEVLDTDVLSSEKITVGDREGVYIEVAVRDDKQIWSDKKVYIYYPEVHHVLELYIGEDVSKEEALKIAEGAKLTVTDSEDAVDAWAWSDYIKPKEEGADVYVDNAEESVKKSDVKGVYDIGETFSVNTSAEDKNDYCKVSLDAKVSDVKVCDDISLLEKKYIDKEFYDETDENGKLLPNKINYVKYGDGMSSIGETVDTSMSNQKLIYATIEYTNNTGKDLKEVLFFCTAIKAVEDDNSYIMYNRTSPDGSWDEAVDTSTVIGGEMRYYDVHGGSKNVNYIESLKAGETKTVNIGIVVNEEELPCTFLCLDTEGSEFSFTGAMETGLVDIRQ